MTRTIARRRLVALVATALVLPTVGLFSNEVLAGKKSQAARKPIKYVPGEPIKVVMDRENPKEEFTKVRKKGTFATYSDGENTTTWDCIHVKHHAKKSRVSLWFETKAVDVQAGRPGSGQITVTINDDGLNDDVSSPIPVEEVAEGEID